MSSWLFLKVLRLDRWTKQRFTPLGRMLLAALIAVGLFALNPRASLAYQLAGLLLAALLGAMLWAPAFRPRLRIARLLPRYATAQVPLRYTLRVENLSRRALDGVEAVDEPPAVGAGRVLAHAREGAPRRAFVPWRAVGYMRFVRALRALEGMHATPVPLPRLAPGASVRVAVELTPTRRGYLDLARVCFTRSDPLGVFRARVRVAARDRILVLPTRHPVAWSGAGAAARRAHAGRSRARSTGAGIDFARLREYRPRDPLRHIHWRAWARLGEPVVKEFHEESPSRNALVLDTFAGAAVTPDAFEEAVSVAASFVADAGWREGRLDLLFAGHDVVHLEQGSEGEGVGRMLEALACVDRAPAGGFAGLADGVLARAGAFGACVLVLLDLDDARRALVRTLAAGQVATLVLVVGERAEAQVRAAAGAGVGRARVHPLAPGQAARVLATLSMPAAATVDAVA